MNLENLNFKNGSEDPEKEDASYTQEEAGNPRLIDQSDYIYPEDRGPIDIEGRDKDEITDYFRKKYGLLDENLITFNKEENKWQIQGLDPLKWKEERDEIDNQFKHDRFH